MIEKTRQEIEVRNAAVLADRAANGIATVEERSALFDMFGLPRSDDAMTAFYRGIQIGLDKAATHMRANV